MLKLLLTFVYFLYGILAYHRDGDNCYYYTSQYSLIADTGVNVMTPILGKVPSAFCTQNTYFNLYNIDCSTPYVNTHPSIVLNKASDFLRSGKLEIDTAAPVQHHVELEACIIATYEGYDTGPTPWVANFTDWTRTFKIRICGEWLTMDPNKTPYSSNVWLPNSGVRDFTTVDTLGF